MANTKNNNARTGEKKMDFNDLIEALMQKPIDEMKELYNNRDIEK